MPPRGVLEHLDEAGVTRIMKRLGVSLPNGEPRRTRVNCG
jgi:hypothetical protein